MLKAVFEGHVRKEFIWFLFHTYGLRGLKYGVLRLSFFTTTACNLGCDECIQKHILKKMDNYQMTLDEIRLFIDKAEKSNYKFDFHISGGEPLLWKNLEPGIRLLRASKICNSITVFTNALEISALNARVMNNIDAIRISRYSANYKNIEELKRVFGEKIKVVDREEFWKNPCNPIPGSVPAQCLTRQLSLLNYRVYACAHCASIAARINFSGVLSNPLEVGFIQGLDKIKKSYENQICSLCISNYKVRRRVGKIKNCREKK